MKVMKQIKQVAIDTEKVMKIKIERLEKAVEDYKSHQNESKSSLEKALSN